MLKILTSFISISFLLSVAQAQTQKIDLADQALLSAFQRDNATLLCLSKPGSLKEIREAFNPYIQGIDLGDQNSYPALARAVYSAFPCPFAPERPELRPATRAEMVGTWLVPDASGKFRHGPKSKSWSTPVGMPTVKCEGVSLYGSGEYRVMQIRGNLTCPDATRMNEMQSLPAVSAWAFLSGGRIKVTRTDVPTHFEEWEVFYVAKPFETFGVQFSVGDLAAYLRREPGNEINATTTFRHLQPLR